MNGPAKVLFIGLDACDAGLVEQFAEAGQLPHFSRLFESSACIKTLAPVGLYVGGHWATWSTGVSPTKHNFYWWAKMLAGSYEFKETSHLDVEGSSFWVKLSERGKRIAMVDVPHLYITPNFNGLLLKEWGCHDRHSGTESWPKFLVDDMTQRFGSHPVGMMTPPRSPRFVPCDVRHRKNHHRTHEEARALWEELQLGHARKAAASLHLLEQGGWDLFSVVMGESHCVGHQYWHLHDAKHPRYDAKLFESIGDPILQMYQQLDKTVGSFLQRIHSDMVIYVYLSHGMEPQYDGSHLLDRVLYRLEQSRYEHKGFKQFAKKMKSRLGFKDNTPQEQMHLIDRSQRRWFAVPNSDGIGSVRINLKGREPQGMISSGQEFDRVCEFLRDALLDLVNVDTGKPVVKEVIRTDKVYQRREHDCFPDLFIEWNRDALIEKVSSSRIGVVFEPYANWRTGDHNAHGMLFALGRGVQPARLSGTIQTVDVTATICSALGENFDEFDGESVISLLPSVQEPLIV